MNKKQFLQLVDSELTAARAACIDERAVVRHINDRGAIAAAWDSLNARTRRAVVRYMLCRNHRGKMHGVWSISTACTLNPLCLTRHAVAGSICERCYSFDLLERQKSLRRKLERNTVILTCCTLSRADVPPLDSPSGLFRFEAFGDLLPFGAQWSNYTTIASADRLTACAAWTKNPLCCGDGARPLNMRLVYSVARLDPHADYIAAAVERFYRHAPYVDAVFSVYSDPCGVEINCGARSCATCRKCYTHGGAVDCLIVSERLK